MLPDAPAPLGLDPLLALALALHNTRGGYALLLGSGVSRAAGIPTGWEVVEDLIRRVAALEGGDAPAAAATNPAAWYRERFGEEPSYSRLLEQIARTPAERRELLRGYFEPTDDDRANGDDGAKRPARAHRAVARLVRDGVVRVVITPNFDQLLETAIREEGITPTVISSPDMIAGMMPLHLERVTIIKVHGDYLDTRIRNTPDELREYDNATNTLLDRVFDEYGLVVCGWSAAWDDALRAALLRAPNRRFSTFWAARGPVSEEAQQLIDARHAQVIPIASADDFLDAVAERIASLASLERPHPLSAAVAVATLKRYLPMPEQRIRLADLVSDEVERTISRTLPLIAARNGPGTVADVLTVVPAIEAACEITMTLLATGTYWDTGQHRAVWVRAIERLGNMGAAQFRTSGMSYPMVDALLRYPGQLGFYAAGLGALVRGRDGEETLADVLLAPRLRLDRNAGPTTPAWSLNLSEAIAHDHANLLLGRSARTPMSDHLLEVLRPVVQPLVADDAVYEDLLDRFEYLVALVYADTSMRAEHPNPWVPVGRLAWRRRYRYGVPTVIDEVAAEVVSAGSDWFLLRRGVFDSSADRLAAVQAHVLEAMNKYGW